jgi:hypothetical protein
MQQHAANDPNRHYWDQDRFDRAYTQLDASMQEN